MTVDRPPTGDEQTERRLALSRDRCPACTRTAGREASARAPLTAVLEIARLIVDRRTNCEIASEPFLSTKTVETHIRNMFRKLDANSRVEIARAVEKADKVLADLSEQR